MDGQTQPCGSTTNTGPCQIGTSTCVDGRFGPCVGAVAPASTDSCSSRNDDSNCNGIPFDGCSCVNGETQSCGMTDTGVCQLGARTCVNGAFGQCVGAVFPAGRNCGSQQDNDCDGRPDNTIDNVCQCIPGGGNGPCSDDPSNSRCNGQGQCVPCQANADCSLVSGARNVCTSGQCVQSIPDLGGTCSPGQQCASGQCAAFYPDGDRDGFAPANAAASFFCAGTSDTRVGFTRVQPTNNQTIDCLDSNIDVKPGQTRFFTTSSSRGFDYNCNGLDEKTPQVVVDDAVCFTDGADGTCTAQGIAEDSPCGEEMVATACVANGPSSCRQFTADGIGPRGCR